MGADQRARHQPDRPQQRRRRNAGDGANRATRRRAEHGAFGAMLGPGRYRVVAADRIAVVLPGRGDKK